MSIPPFRKFPQPKREMTIEEHKNQQDTIRSDEEGLAGDALLHSLMVAAYPHERQQNN